MSKGPARQMRSLLDAALNEATSSGRDPTEALVQLLGGELEARGSSNGSSLAESDVHFLLVSVVNVQATIDQIVPLVDKLKRCLRIQTLTLLDFVRTFASLWRAAAGEQFAAYVKIVDELLPQISIEVVPTSSPGGGATSPGGGATSTIFCDKPRPRADELLRGADRAVGYTGHVAGGQNHFGLSYSAIVDESKRKSSQCSPSSRPEARCPTRSPSRSARGCSPRSNIPGYCGYIHGQRFKFAATHGNLVAQLAVSSPELQSVEQRLFKQPRDGHIPGYSGFIRSSMHYCGSTYGELSRAAITSGARFREGPDLAEDLAVKRPLPTDGHRPGYTGCIHGSQGHFGKSFSKISSQLQSASQAQGDGDDLVNWAAAGSVSPGGDDCDE